MAVAMIAGSADLASITGLASSADLLAATNSVEDGVTNLPARQVGSLFS
jgi:hypothetical protein